MCAMNNVQELMVCELMMFVGLIWWVCGMLKMGCGFFDQRAVLGLYTCE